MGKELLYTDTLGYSLERIIFHRFIQSVSCSKTVAVNTVEFAGIFEGYLCLIVLNDVGLDVYEL